MQNIRPPQANHHKVRKHYRFELQFVDGSLDARECDHVRSMRADDHGLIRSQAPEWMAAMGCFPWFVYAAANPVGARISRVMGAPCVIHSRESFPPSYSTHMDMREIARRAKVSIATVSRAINRVPTVDPQLAKRVWKVVDELGYYPNIQARALVLGRSRIFGLIVSEITNPFFPEIVQTFEDLAVENNYELLLTSTVHDPKRIESSVRRMIERRVDGVAILTFGMEESLIEHLRDRKVPLVFVDVGPDVPGIANIRINYLNGIRQAVQHLAALRHTRIAFIAGPPHLKSAGARREAFEVSMREIGLSPDLVVVGDHRMEGGMKALLELNRLTDPPTAVLSSNDMTAIGVLREAYEQNIKIPDDLSVVGFDDIRLAEFTTPPLTTVQMSQHDLAKIAFNALLHEVASGFSPTERRNYDLVTALVLRRSTALARVEKTATSLSLTQRPALARKSRIPAAR